MAGNVRSELVRDSLVISISGYADLSLMAEVSSLFYSNLENGRVRFVFDFKGMTLINSSALGELLGMISEGLGNCEIRFAFCSIPSACKLGMDSIGLLNHVDEYANVSEAIKTD
ncbi:MAG: hypothetical protein AB1403_01195 [Candidatus Riflebacteria bacterium]